MRVTLHNVVLRDSKESLEELQRVYGQSLPDNVGKRHIRPLLAWIDEEMKKE